MGDTEQFFLSAWWEAITGVVGLLAAIVPAVIFVAGKLSELKGEPQRTSIFSSPKVSPHRSPEGAAKIGCLRLFIGTTLPIGVFFFYAFFSSGLYLALIAVNDFLYERNSSYLKMFWGGDFDFGRTFIATCGLLAVFYLALAVLIVYSTVVALQRSPEDSVFVLLVGLPLLEIPVMAVWPLTYGDVYLTLAKVFSSFVTSLIVLAVTWTISRGVYASRHDHPD